MISNGRRTPASINAFHCLLKPDCNRETMNSAQKCFRIITALASVILFGRLLAMAGDLTVYTALEDDELSVCVPAFQQAARISN